MEEVLGQKQQSAPLETLKQASFTPLFFSPARWSVMGAIRHIVFLVNLHVERKIRHIPLPSW
jgi:hypothetical protein